MPFAHRSLVLGEEAHKQPKGKAGSAAAVRVKFQFE
jgi:hypothetical protein